MYTASLYPVLSECRAGASPALDDHYRYHEGLFRRANDQFVLERTHTYRYDSAGIEFAQWPFWFVGALGLWGIVLLVARWVRVVASLMRQRSPT